MAPISARSNSSCSCYHGICNWKFMSLEYSCHFKPTFWKLLITLLCPTWASAAASGTRSGRLHAVLGGFISTLSAKISTFQSVLPRIHRSEVLECRRWWTIFEASSYHPGTLTRAQQRGVDFKVIDTVIVHFTLPPANHIWHR